MACALRRTLGWSAALLIPVLGCAAHGLLRPSATPAARTAVPDPDEDPAAQAGDSIPAPPAPVVERPLLPANPPAAARPATTTPQAPATPAAPTWPRARAAEMPAALRAAYETDGYDARWAKDTQSRVWDVARDAKTPDATIDGVECRRTLCRLSGTVRTGADRDATLRRLLVGPNAALAAIPMPFYAPGGPAGDASFEIYLLRQ